MTNRITEKYLTAIADRINRTLGAPATSYSKIDGKFSANVGNFHISYAYGGVCLHKMHNESGGVSDVFRCGHVSKRDLCNRMLAYLDGISEVNGEV